MDPSIFPDRLPSKDGIGTTIGSVAPPSAPPVPCRLRTAFDALKGPQVAYFQGFTFDTPIVMSTPLAADMQALGLVLYKAIRHMLDHYRDYLHLLPRDEHDLRIFEICDRYPHPVGTFRTDFVIDEQNHIRVIEMTTRQPLNGFLTSGFVREIAMEQAVSCGLVQIVDLYPAFFDYLQDYIGDARHVCVIKGNERLEEFRFYPGMFEHAGMPCHVIPIADLPGKAELLSGAWVVEELTFDEIRAFPLDIIEQLARCRLHNAIKSLMISHDKAFLSVLCNPEFTSEALNPAETALLGRYLVPTYNYGSSAKVWDMAYNNKDEFILKHRLKGKSEDLFAGCLTKEAEWKQLFTPERLQNMVLQPMIHQRQFTGRVGAEARNDYAAGTLLYFNQEFFGPGMYRSSSLPVSGFRDFRKIGQLVAKPTAQVRNMHYLGQTPPKSLTDP